MLIKNWLLRPVHLVHREREGESARERTNERERERERMSRSLPYETVKNHVVRPYWWLPVCQRIRHANLLIRLQRGCKYPDTAVERAGKCFTFISTKGNERRGRWNRMWTTASRNGIRSKKRERKEGRFNSPFSSFLYIYIYVCRIDEIDKGRVFSSC